MVAITNVYDLTLFRSVAHVLLQAPDQTWREYLHEAWPIQVMLTCVNLPLALIGLAALNTSPWAIPLLAIPLLVIWRIALLGPRMRELHEAERMKATFVSMASHELQTPLTSVIGFAQTLDQQWDSIEEPERRRFLHIIREQGERLSRLVADLLVLSNLDAEIARPGGDPVCVSNALELAMRGIELDLDTSAVPHDVSVVASEDDVVRILVNLLSNAVKYGRAPIVVRVDTSPGWVSLHVIDHGDGISISDRRRVFDHFARGTDLPSHVEGSGLGLAISRSLARAHGGELVYEDIDGAGTCFVLHLPAAGSDRSSGDGSGHGVRPLVHGAQRDVGDAGPEQRAGNHVGREVDTGVDA
jgi:two-component system phosphate regulon sensor histidine kinase PhoR